MLPPRGLRLALLALTLTACAAPRPSPDAVAPAGLPQGTDGFPWWNDTVFYEIFVRSFYDSNGDGIGDLPGLIAKLDYLNDGDPATASDLGVTGLWLMPIHPSPSYHGYDVTDYFAVNPDYGTLEDIRRLVAEAHRRGMRLILDLVLNHTSSQHPWFVAAQDPGSEYRNWYRWSETEPTGGGWHATPTGYYYGLFQDGMPDLNYGHPAVTAQMREVVRFWLQDVGVDGFRLDAAKHLIEEGTLTQHAAATHAWYKDFRPFYKGLQPEALTVGEVFLDSSVTVSQYVAGDELDLAFDFDLAQAFVLSAGLRRAGQTATILARDTRLFRPGQFATLLTNHDQDRAMSVFGDDAEKAKNAAVLLLTAPGVPFIYYGEEIGLLGKKPDEDLRRPMPWTAEANGGFTTGTPWRALHPDFPTKNVLAQADDSDSLLAHYRALIRLRNQHAALRIGDYYPVEAGSASVYAGLRVYGDEVLLVIVNLGREAVADHRLTLAEGPLAGDYRVTAILGDGTFADLNANAGGGFGAYQPLPTLPPNLRLVLRLQPTP